MGSESDAWWDRRSVDRRAVLSGLGVGIAGLAGCMDGGGGGGGDVTVTGVWSGGEEEAFMEVVQHVEEQTDLDIGYEPRDTEAILTQTLTDYEAGVATADIVVMPSPARIQSDAQSGHLATLGDTWDQESFAPDPELVSTGGEVYAAPFKMDLKPGFWYRQSFFDEHGLEEPGDYDEFTSLLDEISGIDGVDAPLASGNGDGWPLSDVTEAFIIRQEEGYQLQRDLTTGDAEFTDDRVVTAFEEIQALHEEGYWSELRDFGVQYEYLWSNEIPLYFMGSWTPGFDAIEDPEDLGVFMLPGTEGMVAAENWFTVPEYTENVDDARTVVEELISAEAQAIWAERGGFIASNLEVSQDAYDLQIMADLAELSGEVELVPDLDDTLGNPFQNEFWSQLTGLWSEPDQDVQSIVEDLADEHQESVGSEG